MSKNRINFGNAAPHVMDAIMSLEELISKSSIPEYLRELIRLRVSQINGCAYCVDMHGKEAINAGETPRRLLAISAWRESPVFNARERAALAWADTLTLIADNGAPDEIYEDVASQFSAQELSELTFIISTINVWNRFGVGFAMQPESE